MDKNEYEELENYQKIIITKEKLNALLYRKLFIEEEISAKQDQLINCEVDHFEALKELNKVCELEKLEDKNGRKNS